MRQKPLATAGRVEEDDHQEEEGVAADVVVAAGVDGGGEAGAGGEAAGEAEVACRSTKTVAPKMATHGDASATNAALQQPQR